MSRAQEIINIEIDELSDRAELMRREGFRLAQIGACACSNNSIEINYSFDKEYNFVNLRLVLPSIDTETPSIAGIYANAFIYENEMIDLFGVRIKDMPVDYKGNFYRMAVKQPFKPKAGGSKNG